MTIETWIAISREVASKRSRETKFLPIPPGTISEGLSGTAFNVNPYNCRKFIISHPHLKHKIESLNSKILPSCSLSPQIPLCLLISAQMSLVKSRTRDYIWYISLLMINFLKKTNIDIMKSLHLVTLIKGISVLYQYKYLLDTKIRKNILTSMFFEYRSKK